MIDYPILESNGIVVDKNKYSITIDGKEIYLTRLLFEVLHFFVSHPNKIITRDDFLDSVWKNNYVGERTVDVHIKKLRNIIGKNKIETINKIGYIWKSN